MKDLQALKGKTIKTVLGLKEESEEIIFTFTDGYILSMSHDQDCCEFVRVYDICGDASDLEGGIVIDFREDIGDNFESEEYKNGEYGEYYDESSTWTFYNITTSKGSVNIRWLGESNGYYSESVDWRIYE